MKVNNFAVALVFLVAFTSSALNCSEHVFGWQQVMSFSDQPIVEAPVLPIQHGEVPTWNQPTWNQPTWNQPTWNQPTWNQQRDAPAWTQASATNTATANITEPKPAIVHFNNTRKSGFVRITLLCRVERIQFNHSKNKSVNQT